jgi:hypothetical protein
MPRTRRSSSWFPSLIACAFGALALGTIAGCFTPPESCSDCNDGTGGVGGLRGGGGALGIGGATSTGGSSGAGGSGAGGITSTGGTGMGGSGAGGSGAGGAGLGGRGTGGSGLGGSGLGGAGVGGAGMGGSGMGGTGMGGAIDVALVAWYQLDDGTGTTAVDSSGHAHNGTLSAIGGGAAAFSTTTHQIGTGSVQLTSSGAQGVGGLITVPTSPNAMGATTAITIACWVNVRTNRAWARIFDFGNSMTTGYMFLTSQQAAATPNSVRFAISTAGNAGEQVINMTTPATLSTGVWHHVAVVLQAGATYTGTLYIDKMVAGTNTAMTLHPSNLGNTTNNWIGRSQFAVDPLFDGFIDDFRIYSRALSATEIAALP